MKKDTDPTRMSGTVMLFSATLPFINVKPIKFVQATTRTLARNRTKSPTELIAATRYALEMRTWNACLPPGRMVNRNFIATPERPVYLI